ncbi:MAG: hypothetical protein IT573_07085 [Deltaproteobacteria bacterium]|nr:hypothetical protein [Deltaproteobacteria bacterium]
MTILDLHLGSEGRGLGLGRPTRGATAFEGAAALNEMFGGDLGRASRELRLSAAQRDELAALGRERDSALFWEGLLGFAQRQEAAGHLELAVHVYTAVVGTVRERPLQARAQARLDAVTGRGAGGARAEFLLRRLAHEASEPTALFAMGAAGAAFRLTRLATLSRLAATPAGNFLTRGFGARAAASLTGFAVEATVFPFAGRLANEALGRSQDWSVQALRRDVASSFIVLGGLKLSGWAAGAAFQRVHGINPLTGQAQRLTGLTGLSQRLVPQAGMLGGIVLGHHVEERLGLREHVDGATTMVDSLAMLLQFNVAGRLTQHAFGERFHAWERRLDQQTEILARGNHGTRPLGGERLGALRNFLTTFAPQPALAAVGGPRAPEGPAGTRASDVLSRPQILMMEAREGEGGGAVAAPHRVDPKESLAVLPMGALTPHGNERTTHQRAVGEAEWLAEVGVMNGHLEYRGDGVFADKQTGEVLNLTQIEARYGEAIRRGSGFRELNSTLPVETPWGGQIPAGLRGEDGKVEARLLEVMGLTPSRVKQLSFNQSSTMITKADQFALQGLYATYRSAVRWGARLDEIVGRNPEALGISTAPGLGGMNHLVHLFLAAASRKSPDSTRTNPVTMPMWLPSTLADSMQGVLVAVLGPKYENSSIGPNPVDVGACATGYKAFAQAADMFRPQWPGAGAVELALFGSSEAPHGHPHARPSATGFNAMGAMETLERLGKRLGLSPAEFNRALEHLERHYAPMTEDVVGFWPSEGAGAGGLIRVHRGFELGLPFPSAVAGYAVRGDQGGKKNPADIGYGGRSALRTALRMAEQWQGMDPAHLDYFSGHLTGTPTNNAAEAALFAEVLPAAARMRLTAYKAFLGHGLGAAGSMEMALLQASIERQLGPGAFNVEGRTLAQAFQDLHPRVQVSPALVREIRMAGGQSQGFAGNNAAALFRRIDDQVLHETYGYSMPEIAAYRSRLSEREAVAREWEEDILTGRKTIGEFLSWFGLGERPAEPTTTVVMPGEPAAPAGAASPPSMAPLGGESIPPPASEQLRIVVAWEQQLAARRVPITDPAHPDYVPAVLQRPEELAANYPETLAAAAETTGLEPGAAPAFLRGMRVRPEQLVVSLGRGSLLTTRGTARATRAAAMHGVDAPLTLAYLSEDFGLTRYNGRDDAGRETWVRAADGSPIAPEQIAGEFGETLLSQSGIREIPLQGEAQRLPVRHGGLIPEPLRTAGRLLTRMGLDTPSIKGGAFDNQKNNLGNASDAGVYGLYAALAALAAFGRPLSESFSSSRFGAAQGSAFPGLERFIEIHERARRGTESTPFQLQSALNEDARGLFLNLLMPHFDFAELKADPRAIERILPPGLMPGQMPNTGGVNLANSAACASGLYALFGARLAMLRTGVPGEYPMDAMMVFGADATFSPYDTAPIVAGFSRRAPMTVDSMVKKLVEQGRLGPEVLQLKQPEREALWETLPQDLRRRAMSESSAPFTRFARGLVVAEAAGGMPWMNFQRAIELGYWPSSRLLGIHVNSGEGGAPNLAAMDQGIVTATMVALEQARAHGGAVPQVVQTHGTSTELNNIAEIQSLYQAFRYAGLDHPMAVSAIKGLVGHSMGAASAVDMVMGVQSLLDGEAPGLFNFRAEDLDPRYAERIPGVLQQLRFGSEPIRGNLENILITSEGFLSSDAAAVLGRFPQDAEGAREMLRDYGVPEHQRAEWLARARENRARAEELDEGVRRGRYSLRDVLEAMRFRP